MNLIDSRMEDAVMLDLVSVPDGFGGVLKEWRDGAAFRAAILLNTTTDAEIAYLPWGAKLMTLECGIRFLTDYLMGDKYFSIDREKHNLDRCRTQFKLVRDMEQKWEQMEAIVQEEYEKLKAKC